MLCFLMCAFASLLYLYMIYISHLGSQLFLYYPQNFKTVNLVNQFSYLSADQVLHWKSGELYKWLSKKAVLISFFSLSLL